MRLSELAPPVPRPVALARAGLWAQVACFFGVGVLPLFFDVPAFAAGLVRLLADSPLNSYPASTIVVGLNAAALFTALIGGGLAKRRRWSRPVAVAGMGAVAGAVLVSAAWTPLVAFVSAIPWFALQVATAWLLFTPAAERWFARGTREVAEEP